MNTCRRFPVRNELRVEEVAFITTMMKGKRALIELLRHEGVKYVFGIPGATEILFMDALEKAPDIRYILSLHEVVCAGMAEGYTRASGKAGFLNLHTESGVAAALPMLYNAQLIGTSYSTYARDTGCTLSNDCSHIEKV